MAGRPLLVSILAILCIAAGLVVMIYGAAERQWLAVAGCAATVVVGVGLWKQWRWTWWIGFALLSAALVWLYQHPELANRHLWFVTGGLWAYFVILFKEFN